MLCCYDSTEDHAATVVNAAPGHDTSEVKLEPEMDARSLVKEKLEQLEGIAFESGLAEMTVAGQKQAAKYAGILNDFPEVAIKLVGFSSENLPTSAHNKKLARDRCRVARVFFNVYHCNNKMAIQGKGKIYSCADEVTIELCETEQVETLESTAITEDAAFAQMQTKVKEIFVEENPAEPELVAETPTLVIEEQAQLNLAFSDARGNVMNFKLTKRPLGINFCVDQTPLEVKCCNIGSHAQDCGVNVGMVLVTIDGKSISNQTYDKAWGMLVDAVNKLPGE